MNTTILLLAHITTAPHVHIEHIGISILALASLLSTLMIIALCASKGKDK